MQGRIEGGSGEGGIIQARRWHEWLVRQLPLDRNVLQLKEFFVRKRRGITLRSRRSKTEDLHFDAIFIHQG